MSTFNLSIKCTDGLWTTRVDFPPETQLDPICGMGDTAEQAYASVAEHLADTLLDAVTHYEKLLQVNVHGRGDA